MTGLAAFEDALVVVLGFVRLRFLVGKERTVLSVAGGSSLLQTLLKEGLVEEAMP